MSVRTYEQALEAIRASLAAKLPQRVVTRSLIDPANASAEDLAAGVLCLVSRGGGDFANTRGREGQLGRANAYLVGYLKVAEDAEPLEIEQAELALLQEVLDWCTEPGDVRPLNAVLPLDWTQSAQLEHPYGWVALRLDVRT